MHLLLSLRAAALRRAALRAVVGLLLSVQAGCYGYAHHVRGPGPDFSNLPINKEPKSEIRWSYAWGLLEDEWSPIECARTDAKGHCTSYVNVCDNGVGRVEVTLPGYAVPLMLLTIGIVLPVRVSAYCSTQAPPDVGP